MPRRDSIELIKKQLFAPEDDLEKLSKSDKEHIMQVRDCYTVWLSNPTYSNVEMRDYLMHTYKIDKQKAYSIMAKTTIVLGNVDVASKNWIKTVIAEILQQSYVLASKDQIKKSEVYTKIAMTWAKAFNTATDEGETLNIKQQLNIENVVITSNPADIGIVLDGKERKDVLKMLKKYDIPEDIIDVEPIQVSDEQALSS